MGASGTQMKNLFKYFGVMLAVIVASIMFVGCDEVSLEGIEIEGLPSEVVSVGETFELQVVFNPENATDKRVEFWTPQNDLIRLEQVTETLVSVETIGAGQITVFARALDGNLAASVTFTIITGSLNLMFGEAVNGVITRTYNAQPQQVEIVNPFDGVIYTYTKEGETQGSTTAPTDVGRYTVTASVDSTSYIGQCEATLVVLPQMLEVRADGKSKVYGASDVALTKRINGQIFDEDVVIDGSLTREIGEDAGSYKIVQSEPFAVRGEHAGNYIVKFVEGNFFISKAPVQVNVYVPAIYYGMAPTSVPTYSVEGLKNDDTADELGLSIAYPEEMKNAGSYDLVINSTNPNYECNFSTTKAYVYKAPITLTVADAEKVYKFDDPTFSYSIYNSRNTADTTKLFYDDTLDLSFARQEGEDAGNYNVTLVCNTENSNYSFTIRSGKLEIKKRNIFIMPQDATKRYGQVDPEFKYEYMLYEGYYVPVENEVIVELSREEGEDVGEYHIESVASYSANYVVDTSTATFTITKAIVSIKVDDVTIAYKDTEPSYTYTVDPEKDALLADNKFVFEFTRPAGENVGNYSVSINIKTDDSNYELSTESGTLTIRERYLYYDIGSLTMAYYQNFDSSTILVILDTDVSDANIENIVVTENINLDIPWRNDIGEYEITATLKNPVPNYKIEFSKGCLSIRTAYVRIYVEDFEAYFGDDIDFAEHLIYEDDSAVISLDKTADSVEFACSLCDASGAVVSGYPTVLGTYTARCTATTPEGKNNYNITIEDGQFNLKQAEITLECDDITVVYGHPITCSPRITDIKGQFLGNQQFGRAITGTDVGEQTLYFGLIENLYSENYKLIYTPVTVTITPAPVVIDIAEKQFKYGDERAFTYTFGEGTDEVFLQDMQNLLITLSGAGTNVGTYDIDCLYLEVGDKHNYDVTVNGAQYTIVPREYKVKVNDATKKYGEADPTFTFALTESSDTLLEGDVLELTYSRQDGATVGAYDITATAADLGSNYDISAQGGVLTITKRSVTIAANDLTITEGQTPTFTYTLSGDAILNNDIEFSLTSEGTTAGTYDITINITKNNTNYDVTCVAGELTINQSSTDAPDAPALPNTPNVSE